MICILPKPRKIIFGNDIFRLQYDSEIVIDGNCDNSILYYGNLLKDEVLKETGLYLDIIKGVEGDIFCTVDKNKSGEGYKITINDKGVTIIGNSDAGLLYGVQTLRQIVRQYGTALPYVEIEDKPDIKNRGYYFDCTRGRVPTLESLKSLADTCSFYKLNQLQLYIEHTYLFKNESEVWRDNTPLTAEEIMEFDEYCKKLHIELIPSLASFGHLYTLMQTQSYSHLCELDVNVNEGYSMIKRMRHHTVDVTNEDSFKLVTSRIEEYMQLFSSKYFNICADETFDLGRGKSKELAEKTSVTDIYVDFLGRICQFVIDKGRIPMFWGDILVSHPEKTSSLPREAVCLNWDYWPDSKEESTANFAKAGVEHLYVCPGVQGWNHLIHSYKDAYSNISRMCTYGHKYNAEGVLTTDWGDCGHIANPKFSTVALIYGAAFSWNKQIIPESDINKDISIIEFGDRTKQVVDIINMLVDGECINWWNVVQYYEFKAFQLEDLKIDGILPNKDLRIIEDKLKVVDGAVLKMYDVLQHVKEDMRTLIVSYIFMAKGQELITKAMCIYELGYRVEDGLHLVQQLECWMYDYKKMWLNASKESEVHRTLNVLKWYADKIREVSLENKC